MNRSFLSNIDGKNAFLKKRIIALCINEDGYSIADLSKAGELGLYSAYNLIKRFAE